MCGIAGQVRAGGARAEATTVERMCDALRHRGPDSQGLHVAAGAVLGMRRLRVIDLATGDQPIFNEDRTVAVVLNGEIYNFRELREGLRRRGHRFASESDTEVIVHLYEEHGLDCVRHLQGMFAFAVWDERRRRLMLARDRVGKKPLFYAHRPGALSFASELPALLADPAIPRDLDPQAIDAFLALRYVPAPLSAFRAVRKLPPASVLAFEDGEVTMDRYWRLRYAPKRTFSSEAEVHHEVREAIRRATRRRMVADVPLGAFLSGGIDSSAVVAAMAEASPEPVRTFSIGFETEQRAFDELPYARAVAREFATEHHEQVVRPDAVEMVPRVVRAYGEPFADSSAIPTFLLAEMTRSHVTVALNGDGGDESFGGYQRYVANLLLGRLDGVPRPVRRGAAALGRRLPSSGRIDSPVSRARRMASTFALDPGERFLAYSSYLDGLERDRLYRDEFRDLVGESVVEDVFLSPWRDSDAESLVDRLLELDVNAYLPGDLLTKVDIATMAHSLEARSPLLDPELMELAASLPAGLKVDGAQKKVALRGALRGWLSDEVLDRPKRGFEVPLADWLRGDLEGFAREILLDRTACERGFFDEVHVRGLLDDHVARRRDNAGRIWTLLVFELWQREIVDRPLPARQAGSAPVHAPEVVTRSGG